MEVNTQKYKHYSTIKKRSSLEMRQNLQVSPKFRIQEDEFARTQKNIKNNPAQAISFGGFFDTGFALVDFVNENEAAYNAIYSLIVAGILKPVAVLNMPGSEEKDKQMIATKNFLQAFLGSFLGLTVGGGFVKKIMDNIKNNLKLITVETIDKDKKEYKFNVLPPASKKALEVAQGIIVKEKNSFVNKVKTGFQEAKQAKGLSKLSKFFNVLNHGVKYDPSIDEVLAKSKEITRNVELNHLPVFTKNPEFVSLLKNNVLLPNSKTEIYDAFESFWKNSTGSATAIAKAMIASALLPTVLNFFFGKKNKQKEQEVLQKQISMLNNSKTFQAQKANFKPFVNSSNNNKNNNNSNNNSSNNNLNFQGQALDKAIGVSTIGLEQIALSKPGAFLSKALSHCKKPSARMADIESILITCYWIVNTIRSKKIDPKQKFGFNLHTGLVTLVSSTAAFLLDALLDPLISWRKGKYEDKIKNIAQKTEELYPQLTKKNSNLFNEISSKEAMNNVQLAQYTIVNELNKLLSDKEIISSLEDDKQKINVINQIVSRLNSIGIIKDNNPVDKNLVENAISNLSVSKQLEDNIQTLIKNDYGALFNSKGIVKELSSMFLKNTESIKDNPQILDDTVKILAKNYGKKMSKFKSLTIFTLVVRLLVPVVMVPYTGKLKKKLVELTNRKKAQAA